MTTAAAAFPSRRSAIADNARSTTSSSSRATSGTEAASRHRRILTASGGALTIYSRSPGRARGGICRRTGLTLTSTWYGLQIIWPGWHTGVVDVDWPTEFGTWLDRIETAARAGDQRSRAIWYSPPGRWTSCGICASRRAGIPSWRPCGGCGKPAAMSCGGYLMPTTRRWQ